MSLRATRFINTAKRCGHRQACPSTTIHGVQVSVRTLAKCASNTENCASTTVDYSNTHVTTTTVKMRESEGRSGEIFSVCSKAITTWNNSHISQKFLKCFLFLYYKTGVFKNTSKNPRSTEHSIPSIKKRKQASILLHLSCNKECLETVPNTPRFYALPVQY